MQYEQPAGESWQAQEAQQTNDCHSCQEGGNKDKEPKTVPCRACRPEQTVQAEFPADQRAAGINEEEQK